MSLSTYGALREIHAGPRFSVFRARRADGSDVIIKQDRSGRPELGGAERLRHEYEILHALEGTDTPRPLELTIIEGNPSLVLQDVGSRNLARPRGFGTCERC